MVHKAAYTVKKEGINFHSFQDTPLWAQVGSTHLCFNWYPQDKFHLIELMTHHKLRKIKISVVT